MSRYRVRLPPKKLGLTKMMGVKRNNPYYFGQLEVVPVGTLAETAGLIGQALGLDFQEDKDGHFDEFPAYVAKAEGLRFGLLGVPDPGYDSGEEPGNLYQLHIDSTSRNTDPVNVDLSKEFEAKIKKDGRVTTRCLR